tara:strand:+ start:155 stop:520 length:366 start_codon:yes stop_codon:yes gene_type:complete
MKIIEYGICIFNGTIEKSTIKSNSDLDVYKNVYDMTQDPPELIHTKTDEDVYIEWSSEEINNFAQNQIYKFYPSWKQSNILREGTAEQKNKMGIFIDAVRNWSNQDPSPNPFDESLELITP